MLSTPLFHKSNLSKLYSNSKRTQRLSVMHPHVLDYVVVYDESGKDFGSFVTRERAVEYAESLKRLRKLECRVLIKSVFLKLRERASRH